MARFMAFIFSGRFRPIFRMWPCFSTFTSGIGVFLCFGRLACLFGCSHDQRVELSGTRCEYVPVRLTAASLLQTVPESSTRRSCLKLGSHAEMFRTAFNRYLGNPLSTPVWSAKCTSARARLAGGPFRDR